MEAFIKSISDIKNSVLQPAQTSQYYVEIPVPPLLSNQMRDFLFNDKDKINLLCCETSLPGVSLATSLNDNDRTGVTEEFAYRKNFDRRIDFTFYVDADYYTPIKYFEAWMKYIAGEDLSEGSLSNNNYHYRFRYPSEYTCQQGLTITKFERDYNGNIIYAFKNAFPTNIESVPLNYDVGQLLKVSVNMRYDRKVIIQSGPETTNNQQQGQLVGEFQSGPNTITQQWLVNGQIVTTQKVLGTGNGIINP